MTIALTNLRYTNPEETNIELMVSLNTGGPFPFDGTIIPFHYIPDDTEPFTLAIKEELAKGTYAIAAYVAPEPAVFQRIPLYADRRTEGDGPKQD